MSDHVWSEDLWRKEVYFGVPIGPRRMRVHLRRRLFPQFIIFFFFNDTATTEIYTLSLHDALPIYCLQYGEAPAIANGLQRRSQRHNGVWTDGDSRHVALLTIEVGMNPRFGFSCIILRTLGDRKSTRLNSSHQIISYAVFFLKKKKREMRLRLGKVTVADVLAAQPVTTNLLKFMLASIKMIGVSNLQSFIASMTQKLTLSDISDESKNYLDKAGITTACFFFKTKWTAGGKCELSTHPSAAREALTLRPFAIN